MCLPQCLVATMCYVPRRSTAPVATLAPTAGEISFNGLLQFHEFFSQVTWKQCMEQREVKVFLHAKYHASYAPLSHI